MSRTEHLQICIVAVLLLSCTVSGALPSGETWQREERNLNAIHGWFTENRGQFGSQDIRFVFEAAGCSYAFMESAYLIYIRGQDGWYSVVKVSFEDANRVDPEGVHRRSHDDNYFIGNDPSQWHSNVPNYNRVIYTGLYAGIDLVLYSTGAGLKYDFILSPGADPSRIRFAFEGAETIGLDETGSLRVCTPDGNHVEAAPVSHQTIAGVRHEIPTEYVVSDSIVTYDLGTYDSEHSLTIDPLIFSSYLGGSGRDGSNHVILDDDENLLMTGFAASQDFPTTPGCYQSTDPNNSICVTKMTSDGSDLIFSTKIGGTQGGEVGRYLAYDENGDIYLTGETNSEDFPTTSGAYDETFNSQSDPPPVDIYVLKLSADGSELLYSTFIGAADHDYGKALVLLSTDHVVVAGATQNEDFPTTSGAYDRLFNGDWDGVIFHLHMGGNGEDDLVWSTLIGGRNGEQLMGMGIDEQQDLYITGYSSSDNFPTTDGAYDRTFNGRSDVIVFKMNSEGSDLLYSTYVGGGEGAGALPGDAGFDLAMDSENNVYVVGQTGLDDYPTTDGCYDDEYNGGGMDVIALKMKLAGEGESDLIYSTFLGGNGSEACYSVELDEENNAYLMGWTMSENFPVTEEAFDEEHNGGYDLFIAMLDPDGAQLRYSTYIGGGDSDNGYCDLILAANGEIVAVGSTSSSDFPVTDGAFDEDHNGNSDLAFFRLEMDPGDGGSPVGDDDDEDSSGSSGDSQMVTISILVAGIAMAIAVTALYRRRRESSWDEGFDEDDTEDEMEGEEDGEEW